MNNVMFFFIHTKHFDTLDKHKAVRDTAMIQIFEPPHDKTNKMTVCPVKTQISQGICPVWLVFAVHSVSS